MATGYEHLAFVAWETGQPEVAIATLQQALAAGVANAEIESKLGMYLAESGRAREGLPLLERAASRPPVEVDTLNALAIGYARAGMDDRAIATFRRVLAIDPHSAMAWQNIGSVELAAASSSRPATPSPARSRPTPTGPPPTPGSALSNAGRISSTPRSRAGRRPWRSIPASSTRSTTW